MLKNIIPIPKKVTALEGKLYTKPMLYTDVPAWETYADVAVDGLSRMYFYDFEKNQGDILITKDDSLRSASYKITVDEKITVSAPDDEGILYGIATLLQLVEFDAESGTVHVEKCVIEDWADKDYRALMIDLVSS